jgi:hypothetical protein
LEQDWDEGIEDMNAYCIIYPELPVALEHYLKPGLHGFSNRW